MELIFLGRGAAFNPKEGNNSAYFIEDERLFLIDCGESVFERIIENNLLDEVKEINLMITHTHSDHIGSLGSLIMYCYLVKKIPVYIIMKENALHKKNIDLYLTSCGCDSNAYKYVNEENYDNKFKSFSSIRYIETHHAKNLHCYSLVFETSRGIVYYSSDSDDITYIRDLLSGDKDIDKLYVDTNSLDTDNGHLYIGVLDREVPYEYKNKIYCMHINNDECIEMAKGLGFNVVEVLKREKHD